QFFNTPSQQSGTRSIDLAREFVKRGYKVIVLTSGRDKFVFHNANRWNIVHFEGIEVHILNNQYSNTMSFLRRTVSFLLFSFFTAIRALKLSVDLVLATSTPPSIAIPALVKRVV